MTPLYVRVTMGLAEVLVVFVFGVAVGMLAQWRRGKR